MNAPRNSNPNLKGQLVAGLATVATVWLTIRSEVGNTVAAEMGKQQAAATATIIAHIDSLASAKAFDFDREQQLRAQLAMDTLMHRIGLIADHSTGTTTYSPRIVVQADTIAQQAMVDQLDGLGDDMHLVKKALAQLTAKVDAVTAPANERRKREQTWPR